MYVKDYVDKYCDVSFTERPFCDGDNAAICSISYMTFENVVSDSFDAEPMKFDEMCKRMYIYNGNRHVGVGLVLPKAISVQMMEMAKHKRFAEMKCVGFVEKFSVVPAVQFAAATLLLPDGTAVVVYRGTDDTLVGWKEDTDILTTKGTPSHKLAVEYLNKAGAKFGGDIIVIGHSKGGNMAQYAALNCEKEIRDRIKLLYNNDGPGFWDYEFMKDESYEELLPKYKHIVPCSSLVGMLLYHDDDYIVVKSKRHLGPLQHDIATWELDGTAFAAIPELTTLGKVTDLTFAEIFGRVNDRSAKEFEKVATAVVEGIGQKGLLGVSKHVASSYKGMKKAWNSFDNETRAIVKGVFAGTVNVAKDSLRTVKEGKFTTVAERIAALEKKEVIYK